jgi:hypothetical protein
MLLNEKASSKHTWFVRFSVDYAGFQGNMQRKYIKIEGITWAAETCQERFQVSIAYKLNHPKEQKINQLTFLEMREHDVATFRFAKRKSYGE